MAEALARHHRSDVFEAESAGMHPLGSIPAMTRAVLEEVGVSTEGLHSKPIRDIELERVSLIVNLTQFSLKGLIPSQFMGRVGSRFVNDPYGGPIEEYRETRETIQRLVMEDVDRMLTALS